MAGPMPPEGSPQEEGAETPQEEGQEPDQQGGSVSDLILTVDKGLSRLAGLIGQAKGVDPKAGEAIAQAGQLFQQGIQLLTGGAGGGPQPVGGSSSMEQGGAKGAQPAM